MIVARQSILCLAATAKYIGDPHMKLDDTVASGSMCVVCRRSQRVSNGTEGLAGAQSVIGVRNHGSGGTLLGRICMLRA